MSNNFPPEDDNDFLNNLLGKSRLQGPQGATGPNWGIINANSIDSSITGVTPTGSQYFATFTPEQVRMIGVIVENAIKAQSWQNDFRNINSQVKSLTKEKDELSKKIDEIQSTSTNLNILQNKLGKNIKGIGDTVKKIQTKIEGKDGLDGLEDKMNGLENKNIETIAVFAAFFTFISVNIQIFSKIENLNQAMIFMLILGISLIILISVVYLYTRGLKYFKSIFSLAFIFSFLLLALFLFITNINPIREALQQKILPDCDSEAVKENPQTCIKVNKENP